MDKKILIVEDEEISAFFYKIVLEAESYNVIGLASNGKDAIELADRFRPDCIIMDIFLEGDMTGIDAVKELNLHHAIPVIYVTANTDERTKNMALETDPFAYITKPVRVKDFIRKVNDAVNIKALLEV